MLISASMSRNFTPLRRYIKGYVKKGCYAQIFHHCANVKCSKNLTLMLVRHHYYAPLCSHKKTNIKTNLSSTLVFLKEYMFSISFRKQRDEKKENNLFTLIIKM